MVEAGFYIGKTIGDDNKPIGTVCSKDISKIIYPLDEYENGLLKTKAGIPYRDYSLNASNSDIIKNRLSEINNSELISSSQYVKKFKGVKNEI